MASVFTRILNGEIPAYKVAEDEHYFAILDVNPLGKGHTLVIPKKETDYLFDMEDQAYLGLMAFAKRVADAVEKSVPCKRIGVAVIGLEVPHVHVHLVPLNGIGDLNFSNERVKLSAEEYKELQSEIQANFE